MANFDLSKLMEGKNPQSVMLAETRELKGKWEQTGLLEGLGEREQSQISVLLENQAKQLVVEASNTGGGAGGKFSSTPHSTGGSGVVILRVPTASYSSTTAGSPTVSTSGDDTIMIFTGSGSYTG